MTHYRAGADAEREARHYVEGQGWLVVRSAGSKGAADLLAFNSHAEWPLAIQVKTNSSPFGPTDRDRLLTLAFHMRGIALLAERKRVAGRVVWSWTRVVDGKDWRRPWVWPSDGEAA